MIFISHTEKDQASAKALAEFLANSIKISPELIKSTGGSTFSEYEHASRDLKHAINESSVILALIPPESLRSSWVIFELGAAWAMDKLLFLFFMPGIDFRDMPELLSNYPSVDVENAHAHITIMDIARDIADFLDLPEKKSGNVLPSLEHLIKTMRSVEEPQPAPYQEFAEIKGETGPARFKMPEVPSVKKKPASNGRDYCDIEYSFDVVVQSGVRSDQTSIRMAWDDIFKLIAPHLSTPQDDEFIQKLLFEICKDKNQAFGNNCNYGVYKNIAMMLESYKEVIRRFSELGYIETTKAPSSIFEKRSGKTYWKTTPKGESYLQSTMVIRNSLQKWVYKQGHVQRSSYRKVEPPRYD